MKENKTPEQINDPATQYAPLPIKIKSKKSLEQPKKHNQGSKLLTSYKHRKIVEAALTGKPLKQAAIDLGYSPKTAESQASQILKRPNVIMSFNRILDKAGVSDDFLASRIRSLTTAKTKIFAQLNGEFTDEREVEALETQRKTIEMAARLKGHLKEKADVDINVGLMQVVVNAIRNPENTSD